MHVLVPETTRVLPQLLVCVRVSLLHVPLGSGDQIVSEQTPTVTDLVTAEAPVGGQVRVYVREVVILFCCSLPEAALDPLQAPEAEQDAAFEVQLNIDDPPEATEVGLAEKVSVIGADAAHRAPSQLEPLAQLAVAVTELSTVAPFLA